MLWLMDWVSNPHLRGRQSRYWVSVDKCSPNSTRPSIFVGLRNSGSRYLVMLLKLFDWTMRTAIHYGLMLFERKWSTSYWRLKKTSCSLEEALSGKGLPGYQKITCHLIFDVRMDFTRKARFVAGGHLTDPLKSITYSRVALRETVRIAFLIAALNDLDVCAADIGNAYLNADCKERIWVKAGKEFGAGEGKSMIIVKALYGLLNRLEQHGGTCYLLV